MSCTLLSVVAKVGWPCRALQLGLAVVEERMAQAEEEVAKPEEAEVVEHCPFQSSPVDPALSDSGSRCNTPYTDSQHLCEESHRSLQRAQIMLPL